MNGGREAGERELQGDEIGFLFFPRNCWELKWCLLGECFLI